MIKSQFTCAAYFISFTFRQIDTDLIFVLAQLVLNNSSALNPKKAGQGGGRNPPTGWFFSLQC